jgi:hypothetical protein
MINQFQCQGCEYRSNLGGKFEFQLNVTLQTQATPLSLHSLAYHNVSTSNFSQFRFPIVSHWLITPKLI